MNPSERLKVLINSSTPIVVMETVEEMRALSLVRNACSDLSLAVFEWTIADGLVRSGSGVPVAPPVPARDAVPQGNREADRFARAALSTADSSASPRTAMYNTADPVQALA